MSKNPGKVVNIIESLNERTKELDCLYQIDEVLRDSSVEIDSVFSAITRIIPKAYRYPDICKARIIYQNQVYEDEPFNRTTLKQSAVIRVEETEVGELQVFYIKPITNEKGIFLSEEQKLLNTISAKISGFLLLKRLKHVVNEEHTRKTTTTKDLSFKTWLTQFGLKEEQVEASIKIHIDFKKGETICKQGAISSYIMILTAGYAKAYLESNQEKNLNFKIIKPFDFIGLSSLYSTELYQFSASTITRCSIYLIDKELFLKLLTENPVFNENIIQWYCRFSGLLFHRLHCIANKQAPGRIADVLHYLSATVFDSLFIPASITRRDIAELAGMSTESAVRILSELKSDGIIAPSKMGIELCKPEIIKRISLAG